MTKRGPAGAAPEILCTLGPSSLKTGVISRLESLGVSLFRINLSHTALDELPGVIRFIQSCSDVPICLDSEGAQVRSGKLRSGRVALEEGATVQICRGHVLGDARRFSLYPAEVISQLEDGDLISIDFNSVLVQVIRRERDGLHARVLTGGVVGQNKAVTVDRDVALPPLTSKDRDALQIGRRMGIRHVALSFANRPSDVDAMRREISEGTALISKIESIEGARNLEALAAKSDALLIDRGDLSRQVALEEIPALQKDIIRRAKAAGAKVYVATNLLESMTTSLTPTRAEVNDIFNTLGDGADGLVLAAETAIGRYPVQCAVMVGKVIRSFAARRRADAPHAAFSGESFLLPAPHGGCLVHRVAPPPEAGRLRRMKLLNVDLLGLLDAEQIALGTFSPLDGFMGRKALESVISDFRLPNGVIWPLPILLPVHNSASCRPGETVGLRLAGSGTLHATLEVEEAYSYDLDKLARGVFGTSDQAHPGVRMLRLRGGTFLAGTVTLHQRLPSAEKCYEVTPQQARLIFGNKGWSRVVSFHTRNVGHRAHEYIQLEALKRLHCDGMLIHPVVGPKKEGDFTGSIILKSYQVAIEKFYPKDRVLLAAFQSYSRYAGPREAVFTALCRKNFGASHFIIGRDHTGVGNHYEPDGAQRLFERLGDIGVTPVFFGQVAYCPRCRRHVENCAHGTSAAEQISGTRCRDLIKSLRCPPGWFMRREVARLVIDEYRRGRPVFV